MQKLDDFLIDKVFQKVADLIYPHISCYALSSFFFVAACIALVECIPSVNSMMEMLMFIILMYWSLCAFRALKLDNNAKEGTVPADRIRDIALRILYLIFSLIGTLQDVVSFIVLNKTPDFFILVNDTSWILATIGLFFIACRKLPPKHRRFFVTADASFDGNHA